MRCVNGFADEAGAIVKINDIVATVTEAVV